MVDNAELKIVVPMYLVLEVTQKCNLNCEHCMKGDACNKGISREVVEKLFDNVKYFGTLLLTGGEPFMVEEVIKMILDVMKEKKIKGHNWLIVTNGTIYNENILNMLEQHFGEGNGEIVISEDDYHDASIKEVYGKNKENSSNPYTNPKTIEDVFNNMRKILLLDYCSGFKSLSNKVFNSGRAKNIDNSNKVPVNVVGYGVYKENNMLAVGPELCISTDGYIVDGNTSYEDRVICNCGNILTDDLVSQLEKSAAPTQYKSYKDFCIGIEKMEDDFHRGLSENGMHYEYDNNSIVEVKNRDTSKYNDEVHEAIDLFIEFGKACGQGKMMEFLENMNVPSDWQDMSNTHHEKVISLKR